MTREELKDFRATLQAQALDKAFPHELFREAEREQRDLNTYGTDFFPYIRWGMDSFLLHIIPQIKSRAKFIDIGCGAGDKLFAVHHMRPNAHITGVDIQPTMVAMARNLCPFARVIEANALELSYHEYDVLYAYRPIANKALWQQLLDQVTGTMKRGATFLCVTVGEQGKGVKWEVGKSYHAPCKFVKEQ